MIRITGADEVFLITKTARTHQMGKLHEFATQKIMIWSMNCCLILRKLLGNIWMKRVTFLMSTHLPLMGKSSHRYLMRCHFVLDRIQIKTKGI